MRYFLSGLSACALLAASPAAATVIASSTFDTDSEGWQQGDFDGPQAGSASAGVTYVPGAINIPHDNYAYAGFLAPSAYLGDLTAARGGTLSFDLSDAANDGQPNGQGLAWTAYLTLYGANGLLIYGGLEDRLPSTSGLSHFTVAIKRSQFYTGGNLRTGTGPTLGGRLVTEAEFAGVLADVARFGIPADFSSNDDSSTLDNVVLTSGVPEPASWALMLSGFGLIGAARRRARLRTA